MFVGVQRFDQGGAPRGVPRVRRAVQDGAPHLRAAAAVQGVEGGAQAGAGGHAEEQLPRDGEALGGRPQREPLDETRALRECEEKGASNDRGGTSE